jgi:hypothetical protein
MALEDVGAFQEWLEREDPPYSLMASVKAWIEGLDDATWQAPSAPIVEMTVSGEYQTREATILGIEVIYQEIYSTGRTDLIYVGRRSPDTGGSD